ncbi:MAG: YkgJ family cysteine cluster protein [Desulfobulbaceae bacterium]|nr:YkgJ family cysteine cluster protein [Desulfobulbaceae bacterium]
MPGQNLLKIYRLYASWAEEFAFACRKGCSTCCTQSVSMTMLEGELIHDYIRSQRPELMNILDNLPEGSSPPKTTNQFAAACLMEEESDDGPVSWNMAPCVFLRDNCCSIYPVRSFMCRSFGSTVRCDMLGEAEIEPLFLTLNTAILQCIEHLDQGRPWGNMNTILQMVQEKRSGEWGRQIKNVRVCSPLPGFLIPPDEADSMRGKLQILMDIVGRG